MSVSNINGLGGNPVRNEGSKSPQARTGAGPAADAKPAASPSGDAVNLGDGAERLRSLEAAVASAPEVDVERITALKQAIADGSYQIDTGKLAEKLIQLERSFSR